MPGPRNLPRARHVPMCSGYTPTGLIDPCGRYAEWHLSFEDGEFTTDLCGIHAAPLRRDADRNNEPVTFTAIA